MKEKIKRPDITKLIMVTMRDNNLSVDCLMDVETKNTYTIDMNYEVSVKDGVIKFKKR